MKLKILIIIGIAAAITMIMGMPVYAQESDSDLPMSNKKLFSKMLEKIGVQNPDYVFKLSDIFGNEEKNYGQNLYMAMYQKVLIEPEETSLKYVAQMKGLSMEEAEAVIAGSVEPLIKTHPQISQEDAMRWMYQMQNIYNEKMEIASLQSEMEAEIAPTEIFANNDTSDSGFDLIADLNDIEKILFMEVTVPDVNMAYSSGAPSKETAKPEDVFPGSEPTYPSPQQKLSTQTGALKPSIIGPKPFGSLFGEEKKIHDEDCPENPTFKNAVDDYNKNNPLAEPPKLSSGSEIKPEEGAGGISGIFDVYETEDFNQEIKPAESSDWIKNMLCPEDKFYCIEFSVHSTTYTSYYPSDPCIACHVEKINENLKKVTSYNLMPRKLTGNLMEMAKCKSGFTLSDLLNINIITVPMPIMTPDAKEAMWGKSITDEITKFVNKYTFFRIDASDKEDFDQAAKMVEAMSSSATTQEGMFREIEKIISENKRNAESRVKKAGTELVSGVQGEFFQNMARQIEQMNVFFETYKQLIDEIAGTCEKIKGKEYVE